MIRYDTKMYVYRIEDDIPPFCCLSFYVKYIWVYIILLHFISFNEKLGILLHFSILFLGRGGVCNIAACKERNFQN